MQQQVLVSIVMITYGHEKYIRQAIEGVLMQDINFEVELIIADDNSPDNTDQVVLDIASSHPNGKWIKYTKHKKNKGMMPNFIFALQQAQGNYIALCDGDDYWTDPYKLQKQVYFLEANEDYILCFHPIKILEPDGRLSGDFITEVPAEDTNLNDFVLYGNYIHTPSVVFRNLSSISFEAVRKVKLGDFFLYFLLAHKGLLKKLPDTMAVYRNGSGIHSTASFESRVRNTIQTMGYMHYMAEDTRTKRIIDLRIKEYNLALNQMEVEQKDTVNSLASSIPFHVLLKAITRKVKGRLFPTGKKKMGSVQPYFSICIPVFNGLTYLKECMDSALGQTFSDYEVIVVDDQSTDGSFELLTDYSQQHPQIKVYRNTKNLGLVGNWNECLKKAEGRWIKFLFQDDFWTPDCLEKVYHFTEISPGFVFHGRRFLIYPGVNPGIKAFYQSEKVNNFPPIRQLNHLSPQKISQLIADYPGFNFIGEPSNVTFKKDLVSRYGYFDSRLVQLCDYEYWVRLSLQTGAFYMQDKFTTFRVHDKATTSVNSNNKYFRFVYLDMMLILRKWVKNRSLKESITTSSNHDLIVREYKRVQKEIINYFMSLSYIERRNCFKVIIQFIPFLLPDLFKELTLHFLKKMKRIINV
jgi:glycosyltransferase involved in cell wall biosynthesis